MEVEPVDEADLGKLFDDMTTREVEVARALLVPAAARLVGLADVYGVRAGWTGAGLELASLPSGQMWIGGFVEPSEVSFYVGLLPPDHYVQGTISSGTWRPRSQSVATPPTTAACTGSRR